MELAFPFFAGILAFLSPCIVPMITVYLSLITGLTADELLAEETHVVRKHIIVNTVYFVIGFSIVYIAAGLAAGYVGRFLTEYQTQLNQIGGVIIILLGLRFAGVFKWLPIDPFGWLKRPTIKRNAPGGLGSMGVGTLFAIACSHCFAGLLTSVLIFAGITGSQTQGAASLALFSLGLAIPFMVTAFAVTSVIDKLKAVQGRLWIFSLLSGAFLVFFGVLTFTGKFTAMAEFFSKVLPY